MRRGQLIAARALMVVGVLALSAVAWRRLLRDDAGAVSVPVTVGIALAVVVGVAGFVWWRGRRAAGAQRAIAADRPGWALHQVWADATLSAQLVQQGVWEPRMSRLGGTRLTLAWSPGGIELWRGGRRPRTVVSLPWAAVAAVQEGAGYAASSRSPAVVVTTVGDATLVVVPAATSTGALLPASGQATAALVGRLRAARDLGGT